MAAAKEKNVDIHLPVDFVTGDSFAEGASVGSATVESGIPAGHLGLDIGAASITKFSEVWCGCVGGVLNVFCRWH